MTTEQKERTEKYWKAVNGYIEGCKYFGFDSCLVAVAPIVEDETILMLNENGYSVSKSHSYDEISPKFRYIMVVWNEGQANNKIDEFDVVYY